MVAIRNFSGPTSLRKLHEFLGLVNFYHHFIPHCATLLDPLNNLLSNPGSNTLQPLCNEQASTAFTAVKEVLTVLYLTPSRMHELALWLMPRNAQWVLFYNKMWVAVGAQSHTSPRNSAQQRGSAAPVNSGCELLAVYLAIKHFHYFVEGQNTSATSLKDVSSSYSQTANK